MSHDFQEPAFNRAIFTDPPEDPEGTVPRILGKFRASGSRPSLFVPGGREFGPLLRAAERNGFRKLDRFLVMVLDEPRLDVDSAVGVRTIAHPDAGEWSLAYLEAFYGDDALLDKVVHCVRNSLAKRSNRLLLAERGGEAAGTMALHVGGGFVGLYCLGTVPSMRGKGVAGSLVWSAQQMAERLGTKVILQTFESDGVEEFYLRRGFRWAFAQEVLSA